MQGINNLGSTCAINSLIQMITRCDKLREIILNSNTTEGTFTNELKEIIDLMHNQNKSLNPAKFLNSFYTTFKGIFNRYEQIDINELWFYICEKINEETSISLNQFNFKPENLNQEHDIIIQKYNLNKTSKMLETVQGSFIKIIQCSHCNHKSHSFEPFINIGIDLNTEIKTVADLIITSLKDELREKDEWKCENCNGNHQYLKMKRLWKLPEILFLTINRFSDVYNKNNTEVYVNEFMIFNKGSVLSINNDSKYELQSMGLHYGSLMGGHYMSVCKIDDKFYLYNDNQIQVIDRETFINSYLKTSLAYLLVYKLTS